MASDGSLDLIIVKQFLGILATQAAFKGPGISLPHEQFLPLEVVAHADNRSKWRGLLETTRRFG